MAERPIFPDAANDDAVVSRAAEYRRKALWHERLAARCQSLEIRDTLERIAQSYFALAENEEWLEGKIEAQRGMTAART